MSRFMKTIAAAALIPALSIMATASFAAPASAAAATAAATPAGGNFTDTQTKQIQSVVADFLKQNPQVIISALQEFQRQQMQNAEKTIQQTQKDAAQFVQPLFHTANDPVAGNQNGAVTIVEFFDYQCPHCVDMSPVLSDAVKNNPNIRVIFKEFPIKGPISDFASRAALAANMQGKYVSFHDGLMKASQPYTQESILAVAKAAGLNIEQLQKDMDSPAVKGQIQANMKLAQDLKLLGTPAFFIGKTNSTSANNINYVPGQIDTKQLQEMIKKFS
jgi:protein-disulfide isomerase